jgi:hypothetical protein
VARNLSLRKSLGMTFINKVLVLTDWINLLGIRHPLSPLLLSSKGKPQPSVFVKYVWFAW